MDAIIKIFGQDVTEGLSLLPNFRNGLKNMGSYVFIYSVSPYDSDLFLLKKNIITFPEIFCLSKLH